ncbi:MAG TPA: choice-of-anchor D domain-containing protein [Candidatus Acidoferrales bacterium]|nr:choice-of-anchor D domain-containing protein [Candidatus Acidoferrales bacterium]
MSQFGVDFDCEAILVVTRMLGVIGKLAATGICLFGFAAAARSSEPIVLLSTNRINFGPQIQGTNSTPQPVVLTNNGDGELTITSFTFSGQNSNEFRQTDNCPISPLTLAAGASCTIQVQFRPRSIGSLTASLAIADNASGSPHSISLTGSATAPAAVAVLTPETLAFENQPAGSSSGVLVATLTNAGSALLNISSPIQISGPSAAEFHLQRIVNGCPYDSGQIPPREKCGIGVVFAPTTAGSKSAQVVIEDDAGGSPHSIALSGTGVAGRD